MNQPITRKSVHRTILPLAGLAAVCLVLAGVLLLALRATAASPAQDPIPAEVPTPVPAPPLSVSLEQLLNAAIVVPSISPTGTLQLLAGSFTNPSAALSVSISQTLVALGDVNGDGLDDAAAVLVVSQPGALASVDLVLLSGASGQPVTAGALRLGSSILVDAIRIERGAVWLDLRVPGPADEACCPTLPLKRIYILRGSTLQELPAASYGRLFPYRYGSLWGYVNVLGEFVVPPQYAYADSFSEGLALVSFDGTRFGFINTLGQTVIPQRYQFATPFSGGLTVAGVAAASDPTVAGGQDYVVYLDRSGNNIFGELTFAGGLPFSEGLAAVKGADGKYGFVNRLGQLVIPAQYDIALPFAEGRAPVLIGDKVGYISRRGETVIPAQFDAGDRFAEGLAAVAMSGTVGYVDQNGATVIPPQFERGGRFSDGLANVRFADGEGYIDLLGGLVISATNYSDGQPFAEGLAAVRVDGLFGYVNERGVLAIAPQYTSATPFHDGLAMVETADAWSVIAADGMPLVQLALVASVAESTTVALAAPPATDVISFVPQIPDEIRPGDCYSASEVVEVASAYRCGVGAEVFDPCLLGSDAQTVVCAADPSGVSGGFALELSRPISVAATVGRIYPGAWVFQLGSGAVCRYVEGASITIEGQRINYTCSDLTQLLGDVDKSTALWTINSVTTTDDGNGNFSIASLTPVSIVRAWQPALVSPPSPPIVPTPVPQQEPAPPELPTEVPTALPPNP